MQFPEPSMEGPLSVETALANRRSIREFANEPLTPDSLGQILWATYGVSEEGPWNRRTVPSPAAMYPMELYVVAGDVEGLEPGVYRYEALGHFLEEVEEGDLREELAEVCMEQDWIAKAPAILVITAAFDRVTQKFGERGVAYTFFEAGLMAQNCYLQAEALGLGVTAVGAFKEEHLMELLELPPEHNPMLVMPIGWKDFE